MLSLLLIIVSFATGTTGSDLISIQLFKGYSFPNNDTAFSKLHRSKRDLDRGHSIKLACRRHNLNFGIMNIGGPVYPQNRNLKPGGQHFKMLFDTGSIGTWVPAEGNFFKKSIYNSYKATKKTRTDYKFKILYLDGDWAKGHYHRDTVCIGKLCATDQFIGAACDTKRSEFEKFDGIFGLGNFEDPHIPSTESAKLESNRFSILEYILRQNQLPNVFSFWLHPTGGILTLGGADKKLYVEGNEKDIKWFNVIPNKIGAWKIEGNSFWADGEEFLFRKAILDTGAESIYGPDNVARHMHQQVDADYRGYFNCKRIKELPDLTFAFDDYKVTMTPEEYVREMKFSREEMTEELEELLQLLRSYHGGEICHVGILPWDVEDDDYWLLGERFLRKVYTVHDVALNRVGFATPISRNKYLNLDLKCY